MKKWQTALIIAAFIVLLAGIAGGVAWVAGNLDKVLALAMDNPYVDEGFPGWQEVGVEGLGSVRLPGEWTLTTGEPPEGYPGSIRTISITSETGVELARGCLYASDTLDCGLVPEALQNLVGFPITDAEELGAMTSQIGRRKGASREVAAQGDGQTAEVLLFELSNGETILTLWFPLDDEWQSTYDITDAVMYAYVAGKE